jgi:hypothetical protein
MFAAGDKKVSAEKFEIQKSVTFPHEMFERLPKVTENGNSIFYFIIVCRFKITD